GPAVGRAGTTIRYPSDRYPIIRTALLETRPKQSMRGSWFHVKRRAANAAAVGFFTMRAELPEYRL
ncbi:hypothetical protein, partial [Rhodococcus indonesiensis]